MKDEDLNTDPRQTHAGPTYFNIVCRQNIDLLCEIIAVYLRMSKKIITQYLDPISY